MKYLCLAFYDPVRLAAMLPEERRVMLGQCPAKDAELQATGQLRVSASLGGADKVVSIRPRKGRPEVKDGPFTESKEVVGGFFIIEAANVQEALKVARLHPAAKPASKLAGHRGAPHRRLSRARLSVHGIHHRRRSASGRY